MEASAYAALWGAEVATLGLGLATERATGRLSGLGVRGWEERGTGGRNEFEFGGGVEGG